MTINRLNSLNSTTSLSRGTTSGRKRKTLNVDLVSDVIDQGEWTDIKLNDGRTLSLKGDMLASTMKDLKDQIRAREYFADRAEIWEAYEEVPLYKKDGALSHLTGRAFSFNRYMNLIKARMTKEEKEQLLDG